MKARVPEHGSELVHHVARVVVLTAALTTALTVLSTVVLINAQAKTSAKSVASRPAAAKSTAFATAPSTATALEGYLPGTHFRESRVSRMRATPSRVAAAMHAVRPNEIRGLGAMMWMIGAPRTVGPADAPLMKQPMFEALRHTDVIVLADRRDEFVLGAIGQFWKRTSVPSRDAAAFRNFHHPQYAKVVTRVTLRPETDGGCQITTETRAFCADPGARRQFETYWRVAAPGRALLETSWLNAVRRRAEGKAAGARGA